MLVADKKKNYQKTKDQNQLEQIQYVVFDLGVEEYGIDIDLAKEIIKPGKITPVPNTEDYVSGVINLRGQIIPVVDLYKRFKMEREQDKQKARIIIVEIRDTLIGLLVDRVKEIIWLDKEKIEDPPEIAGGIKQEFLEGVGTLNDHILIIVDLDKTLFGDDSN